MNTKTKTKSTKRTKPTKPHTIPPTKWTWLGHAAHFCAASNCLFHLTTIVGDVVVSSVGDYHPPKIEPYPPAPTGYRPDREKEKQPIGAGPSAYYETFVFRLGETRTKLCSCGCGNTYPNIADLSELIGRRYATSDEACVGHMEVCTQAARGEFDKKERR